MRKKWLIRLMLLAAVIVLILVGLDQRLIVRTYTVESGEVTAPVRLAVLTDYHGCDYGPYGSELLAQVMQLTPDAILLVGDMFPADHNCRDVLTFFQLLAGEAPTFYVTGNHEYWEQDVPALMEAIAQTGVAALDASCAAFMVNGQSINICGIPDPYAGVNTGTALAHAAAAVEQEGFTVLLAHRPELINQYAANGSFDLVVSGHAHGGQVRIPFLVNGLCAPDQGWFPKYAGGLYEVNGTTMIVSRGLSTQRQMGVPRMFNRPELVVVDIQ